MPTNGNAGAAWSLYAARAGLGCLIVMPLDAPRITQRECVAAGAELYLVDGLINHAGALVSAAVERRVGYQEVSTLKEPYRVEGKKTMGYEIAEQLGWRVAAVRPPGRPTWHVTYQILPAVVPDRLRIQDRRAADGQRRGGDRTGRAR